MPPPIPPHIVGHILFDLGVGYNTLYIGKRWKVSDRAVRKIHAYIWHSLRRKWVIPGDSQGTRGMRDGLHLLSVLSVSAPVLELRMRRLGASALDSRRTRSWWI